MRWILNIIVFIIVFGAFGQQLDISIDKEEILIGEPFTLTYSIVSDVALDTFSYNAQKPLFEAKKSTTLDEEAVNVPYELEVLSSFVDTSYKEGEQFVWRGSYRLTGWDSAYVIVPPEYVSIGDSIYTFPPGLIHVISPMADPSKPIYDINEAFTVLPDEDSELVQFVLSNWWWLLLIAVALVLLLLYLKKRKHKTPVPLSLREETLLKIDLLEKSKGYESNLKEYYFDLSLILRRFFAAHYQERVLDKTTAEIEEILSKNGLDIVLIKITRQLLTQSDMVKFAQSQPGLAEIQAVTNDARKVVNEIADLDNE